MKLKTMPDTINERLMIPSDLKFLGLVRNFVIGVLHQSNKVAAEKQNKIILAVDEAVTNIIEHGYDCQKTGYVDIQIVIDTQKIQVNLLNNGKSFNPTAVKAPDIIEYIKNKRRKGFGLFLIKQVMDEIKYSINNGEKPVKSY